MPPVVKREPIMGTVAAMLGRSNVSTGLANAGQHVLGRIPSRDAEKKVFRSIDMSFSTAGAGYDLGTDGFSSGDTLPPAAPTDLTATRIVGR
jgi:hypothetical protein